MQQIFFCPRCGSENNIGQRVCRTCGFVLPTRSELSKSAKRYPSTPYQSRTPRTLTPKPDTGKSLTPRPSRWSRLVIVFAYLGGIGTVLALILGIFQLFLFINSQVERELVYAVNPTRTVIVASRQCHDLKVSYRDRELGCVDITAVQITILNKGRQFIRTESIFKPVYILASPPVEILDASVIKTSRDTIEFALVDPLESWKTGQVPVEWHILEKNDGAMIQLIYLGGSEIEFKVVGDIEGVSEIKRIDWKSISQLAENWTEQ